MIGWRSCHCEVKTLFLFSLSIRVISALQVVAKTQTRQQAKAQQILAQAKKKKADEHRKTKKKNDEETKKVKKKTATDVIADQPAVSKVTNTICRVLG